MALKKGETAGTRIETWPPEVQTFIDQHVNSWVEENKRKRAVRAMTVAAPKNEGIQSCVVILHHVRKGTQSARRRAALASGVPEEPGDV